MSFNIGESHIGPGGRIFRPSIFNGRLAHLFWERARAWAFIDLSRLALCAPVAIGSGAGLYFGLKTEPSWLTGVIALAASSALTFMAPRIRRLAIIAVLVALGFVAADLRTAHVAAPIVKRDLGIVDVTGVLLSVEESTSSRRIVLDVASIGKIAPEELPARARITWRGKEFNASPGDTISIRAGLGPPPPPVSPGGFDFARQLYFQKIGTVGFAVTPPVVDEAAVKTRKGKIDAAIETLRFNLFHRITKAAPGEGGAIIAALVTGKRDAISERSENVLRDTGLAHLLAISGLHMGLATGLVFFSVRLGLAYVEPIALRFPIKKWAALAALVSGFIYLVLSGGGWSARRAFIMAAIMFAAILSTGARYPCAMSPSQQSLFCLRLRRRCFIQVFRCPSPPSRR